MGTPWSAGTWYVVYLAYYEKNNFLQSGANFLKLLIPNQSMIQPGEGSADSTVLKKSRDDSSGGRDWKKEMQKKSKREMSPQQPKMSPQQAWQQ